MGQTLLCIIFTCMYTQVPLSTDDQQLIKSLRRAASVESYMGIGLGIILTLLSFGLVGLMMSDGYFPGLEILLSFFLVLFCLGVFLLYRGFRIHHKTKEQFEPMQAKRIVTGRLQHLETTNKNQLRYTIRGTSLLVYVSLPLQLVQTAYKRPLISAEALLNREVTLHLVPIEPGVELLLQSHYNQSLYQTNVLPLEEGDKQRQLDNFMGELKVFLVVFAVIGFIILMIMGFKTAVWIALGLMLSFFLIFFLCISLPRIINIMNGTHKICITTTITERIEAMAKSGRSMSKHTWYRLGNGTLEQHQVTTFYPGDTVLIEHLEKKNSSKGTLLDIKKV